MTDNKNFYLAIALSILVILGWNYFYGLPQMQRARQAQAQLQSQAATPQPDAGPAVSGVTGAATPPATPATTPGAVAPETVTSRTDALASSPRVALDTPSLSGSIDLKGGRIDDVSLKNYRQTTDPNSPIIELLSPSGSPHPFYAEIGYVGASGGNLALPGADTLWTADGDRLTDTKPLTLTYDNGQGLKFSRTIAVDDHFMFTVKDSVENTGSSTATLYPYALVSRHGKPEVSNYAVLHEGLIGVVGDSRVQEIKYDAMAKEGRRQLDGTGGWIGITDKYWAAAVVPDQSAAYKGTFQAFGTQEPRRYQTDAFEDAKQVAPGQTVETTTRVFAGAKENNLIDTYQADYKIKSFDLLIDWGWFYFITKPLFKVLDFFYKLTGNFGIAILIVTVLIKGLFFPLANRSYLSMAKMKNVQPQLAAIKERFPDDKQKQQEATMEIYKRDKINPVAGCLPMVIQIPVFFALYKVIFITIEMRQAPFFGWIKDLSSPDPTSFVNLFGLLPFTPPHALLIGVWPLIMGVSMFMQMKMNPEPPDPVQKTMFTYMPLIFTYMLSSFPSGLVIYWTWNNTLSVLQQYVILKRSGGKVELWNNLSGMFKRA